MDGDSAVLVITFVNRYALDQESGALVRPAPSATVELHPRLLLVRREVVTTPTLKSNCRGYAICAFGKFEYEFQNSQMKEFEMLMMSIWLVARIRVRF